MISHARSRPSSPNLSRRSRSERHSVDDPDDVQPKPRRGEPDHGKPAASENHAVALRNDRGTTLALFDLSGETVARLDRFVELLLTWQRQTNLIAPSTIPSLWTRHVADSLQLLNLIDTHERKPRVWLDVGSGGGFPGIVIACALADVPGTQVHLVESNLKKAAFLREAVRITQAPGIVHAARIESLFDTITVDYVTARALAPLPDLLELIAPFVNKGAKALLLKGQDLDRELTESTKHWHIEAETVPSRTSKAGRILVVHALSRHTLSTPFNLSRASSGE
jgi:16S rRNA (guanine527-N7)-methyltransferase